MTLDERLDTLGALWSLWAEHGRAMTDEQWRRPTRLGDWDVRSLYAHAGAWPFGLSRLVDRVRHAEPTHASAAGALGPVVVDYSGRGLLRLDEAVSIGVMEATVHLLDLRHALGQPADLPADGLAQTAAVLVAMAPPVDLIEAATGRSTATPFPVLS